MFNGIIFNKGTIKRIIKRKKPVVIDIGGGPNPIYSYIKKATNNLYFGYMTIIRHPISKIYMLYYRSADTVRNFNVVANEDTGLLDDDYDVDF